MAAKKWLATLVGAAAVYWIYSKYRFSQGVSFIISRIGLGGSILDPQINLDVTINNPTAFTTQLSNLKAELFLESGTKVADVFYNNRTVILANSQAVLPLKAVTTLEGAIVAIREVIQQKKANFRLTGTAQVDGILLPFDIKYSFNGF
jgi:LEA14-like dessication related protein